MIASGRESARGHQRSADAVKRVKPLPQGCDPLGQFL